MKYNYSKFAKKLNYEAIFFKKTYIFFRVFGAIFLFGGSLSACPPLNHKSTIVEIKIVAFGALSPPPSLRSSYIRNFPLLFSGEAIRGGGASRCLLQSNG